MREKKHERKCRGTSRGMGRNVKKSHGEAGKDRKPFSQGRGNRKRPFCGRQQNGFRPEARESGKRQGIEAGQPGRTGEKHKRFGISGLFKKIKAKTGAGADKPKKRRKSHPKREKQDKRQYVFFQRERANGAREKKKHHAGGHGARRDMGHSV